jgi:hypothetical protein
MALLLVLTVLALDLLIRAVLRRRRESVWTPERAGAPLSTL